jgi:hypothetical protein
MASRRVNMFCVGYYRQIGSHWRRLVVAICTRPINSKSDMRVTLQIEIGE